MFRFIQKCLDTIGLRHGNPVRSFLRQIFLFFVYIWNFLLFYPRKVYVYYVQHRYKRILKKLHEKASKNEKIAVGFYAMYDSDFSFRPLFEKMLQDDFFDPFIVIAPDTLRGKKNEIERAKQTYESLTQKYGYERIILGYDYQNDIYSDPSDRFDIIAFANPYDNMTHKYYSMKYLCRKNILTIFTNYGYPACRYVRVVHGLLFTSLVWRVFVENEKILSELKKCSMCHGSNLFAIGYGKMDLLPDNFPHEKKTIIISPHHTVSSHWKGSLCLSNFLRYAQFFHYLPKKYPNIIFVFRPHPLLLISLVRDNIWTQKEVDSYMQSLLSNDNVIFSDGGEYYDLFASSDGIIHDCGSFTGEYMFTEKPACYLLRNEAEIKEEFIEFGQRILEHYYKAYSEEDIINYIENVILKGNDPLREARESFVQKEMKINYKNVSNKTIQYLKTQIQSTGSN